MKAGGWILPLVLLLTTVGCDRVTKRLAVVHLAGAPPQSYLQNTIRLEYAENKGAFLSLSQLSEFTLLSEFSPFSYICSDRVS